MKYNTILFRPRSLKIHIKETRRIVWGGGPYTDQDPTLIKFPVINVVIGNPLEMGVSIGKSPIKSVFSIAMFDYRRVYVNLAYRLGAPQPLFTYPIWYPMIFPQQSPNLTLMVPLSLYFSTMLTTTISWYNHYCIKYHQTSLKPPSNTIKQS